MFMQVQLLTYVHSTVLRAMILRLFMHKFQERSALRVGILCYVLCTCTT